MYRKILTVLVLSFVIFGAKAQIYSSLNAFSPYTMYGLGSMSVGGNLSQKAMGGIGVAYSSPFEFNYVNPASLGSIGQRTAIFNFGLVSSNYYQSSAVTSTTYNSVDLSDIALAVPLAKGVGLGVSLTPYTSIGYNTLVGFDDQDILEEIGQIVYSYYGDGGISKLSTSIGAEIFRGFNIGATMHYNFGAIQRNWSSLVFNVLNNEEYRTVTTSEVLHMSKLSWSVGAQWKSRIGDDDYLTVGATYDFAYSGDMDLTRMTTSSSSNLVDTVSLSKYVYQGTMPAKIAGGLYYYNTKFGVGIDYSRQDWRNTFELPDNISYCLVNDYRVGVKYTPDRYSIRSFMSRMTYKAGFRYSDSYMAMDNYEMDEWAVTFGCDIPMKMRSYSAVSLGFEFGSRGNNSIQNKEDYFKVYLGISIFASDDMWFVKRKFN